MNQPALIPPSWDELIPSEHVVRVVNRTIDKINLEPLLAQYKGGGVSSFHPQMMLKVLVYAYSQRVYSSRQIAKALRENIHYIWISGGSQPDFRTINRFRGVVMKEVIEEVFGAVLELLIDEGYVKLENYFVDGTKVEANANRHKAVWAKSRKKYEERLRKKVKEILEEVERVNAAEDEQFGNEDPDDPSGKKEIDAEKLEKKIQELNERLKKKPEDKKLAIARIARSNPNAPEPKAIAISELVFVCSNFTTRPAKTCSPSRASNCVASAPLKWKASSGISSTTGTSVDSCCGVYRRSKPRGVWSALPIICKNWRVDHRHFFVSRQNPPTSAVFQ